MQLQKPLLFNWNPKNTYGNIPSSRVGATLTQVSNEFYLFGGQSGDRLNELKCLSYETLTWSTVTAVKDMEIPEPRDGHTALAFKHFLVVYGGAGAFDQALHTRTCSPLLHLLDTQDFVWKIYKPLGMLPDPRRNHAAVVVGSTMLLYGGINNNSDVLDDFRSVNLESMQWFSVKFTKDSQQLGKRHSFTMTSVFHSSVGKNFYSDMFSVPMHYDEEFSKKNSGIYIFGGMNEQGRVLNDLYLCQIVKKQARTDKNLLNIVKIETLGKQPLPRYLHSAGLCGKFLVIVGGRNDSLYASSRQSAVQEISAFNISDGIWCEVELSGAIPMPLWGIACASIRNRLLCFGGMNLNSFATNDLWVLGTGQDFTERFEFKRRDSIRITVRRNTRGVF